MPTRHKIAREAHPITGKIVMMNCLARTIVRTVSAAALTVTFSAAASADAVEDFFRGKTMTLICYSTAGSTYDLYSRMLAKHMPNHIPGKPPTMIVKNMTGAGGLTATRYLYSSAPKDGTTIGNISRGIPFEPLLGGSQGVDFDPLKFFWLGSMARESALAVSWHTAQVKTAKDLFSKELMVAGSGAGADSEIIPKALNGLVGTKFKVISGYPGLTPAALAMERGEVEGIAYWSWGAIKTGHPDWVRDKKINLLFQTAEKPHPDIPNVPTAVQVLAKSDEERQGLELLFARDIIARPFLAPPDVPADRAKALKAAFEASLKDKALLAEADKARAEIELVSGEEVVALLKKSMATPPAVVERLRAAMNR
jgi:tripartite-type tricarboxylate transporter receptor subunit TctC